MPAENDFPYNAPGLESPPEHWFAITPADGSDLTHVTRAIHVGTAGDITVDTLGGESGVLIPSVLAGRLVGRFTRVYSTGTTAAGLVGCY